MGKGFVRPRIILKDSGNGVEGVVLMWREMNLAGRVCRNIRGI